MRTDSLLVFDALPATYVAPLPPPDPRAAQRCNRCRADELRRSLRTVHRRSRRPAESSASGRSCSGRAPPAHSEVPTRLSSVWIVLSATTSRARVGTGAAADLRAPRLLWLDQVPGHDYSAASTASVPAESGMTRAWSCRRPDWSLAALVTMRIHELAGRCCRRRRASAVIPAFRNGVVPAPPS